MLFGQVYTGAGVRASNLISPKRGDDRRPIRERDVVTRRDGPESLRERHTRVIHDTAFTTEISADVHLRLVEQPRAHAWDVGGRGGIQVDGLQQLAQLVFLLLGGCEWGSGSKLQGGSRARR